MTNGNRDIEDEIRPQPDVAQTEAAQPHSPEEAVPANPFLTRASLLWHVRWTGPLHVVLPIGLWWLMQNDPSTAATAFFGVHAGFPVLLFMTVRWWRGRLGELLVLLFINHLISFIVILCLPW